MAGGLGLATPFGTVYSTNITPDAETGIGGWSPAAFRRALRDGVSRDGHFLYPAFPYDHFTRLTDADIDALYAFAMTRDPVSARAPANTLRFPLNFRPLLAGWDLLYLHAGPRSEAIAAAARAPAPSASAGSSGSAAPQDGRATTQELQHGAYLVDALAHCSACHSPRNALGAEIASAPFAGGLAEGWQAPALDAHSPSPVAWTVDALAAYLRHGIADDHAMAAGPMQQVTQSLSSAGAASEADVHAIAAYMQTLPGPADAGRGARELAARARAERAGLDIVGAPSRDAGADAAQLDLGARVYADTCARCHDLGRQASSSGALKLPLAIALQLPQPTNLIHIVREGIRPPPGQPGRWMPGFEGSLTDEQITALAIWLRLQASEEPPWRDVAAAVRQTRSPSP